MIKKNIRRKNQPKSGASEPKGKARERQDAE